MKKLNQKGFAHLVIVAIIVVIGVAGFAGYKVYQSRQLTAKAKSYRWTWIRENSNKTVRIYACIEKISDKQSILRAYAVNTGKKSATWKARHDKASLGGTVSAGAKTNVHYKQYKSGNEGQLSSSIDGPIVNDAYSMWVKYGGLDC